MDHIEIMPDELAKMRIIEAENTGKIGGYEDITIPDPIHNIANEIKNFAEAVENSTEVENCPLENTANTLRILANMMESSNNGGIRADFK